MYKNNQHHLTGILTLLLATSILFISGCAGIGIPVIGSPYTPSVKDIGIPDYLIVKFGEVYRGGQPTNGGFDYLKGIKVNTIKGIKIKTIIKLNSDKEIEERSVVESDPTINLVSTVIEPDGNPFQIWAEPDQTLINTAMTTLMDENNWPIYVHCKNGWDRTGLIIAMFRVCHDKYSKSDAYNEMIMNGFSTSHRLIWTRGIKSYWEKFHGETDCKDWPHIEKK
jgi:protein-tyrosine phosphatase